jgi:hypothetical protein
MENASITFWALYSHINQFFIDGGSYDKAIEIFDNIDAIDFFYNYNLTNK